MAEDGRWTVAASGRQENVLIKCVAGEREPNGGGTLDMEEEGGAGEKAPGEEGGVPLGAIGSPCTV